MKLSRIYVPGSDQEYSGGMGGNLETEKRNMEWKTKKGHKLDSWASQKITKLLFFVCRLSGYK